MKMPFGRLYCFSPPVMLVTFFLEIIFVLYTLWRHRLTPVSRLVVAIILFLAGFQLSEYMVCAGGLGASAMTWSRLGYLEITMLPILSLHLAMTLAHKHSRLLLVAGYASALAFVVFFLFVEQAITGQTCLGNYVIFSTAPGSERVFTLYYYGWLLIVMYLSLRWAAHEKNKHIKKALHALTIGYVAFLFPTTVANIIDPATIAGIPSIMCGFAVLFALALVGWVLPASRRK